MNGNVEPSSVPGAPSASQTPSASVAPSAIPSVPQTPVDSVIQESFDPASRSITTNVRVDVASSVQANDHPASNNSKK